MATHLHWLFAPAPALTSSRSPVAGCSEMKAAERPTERGPDAGRHLLSRAAQAVSDAERSFETSANDTVSATERSRTAQSSDDTDVEEQSERDDGGGTRPEKEASITVLKMLKLMGKAQNVDDPYQERLQKTRDKADKLLEGLTSSKRQNCSSNSRIPKPLTAQQRSYLDKMAAKEEGRRVISFSLYYDQFTGDARTFERYLYGCHRNAELIGTVFPGWRMRLYYAQRLEEALKSDLNQLRGRGVECISVKTEAIGYGQIEGMFWRWIVADDPSVDRFLIRDVDSRLGERDARAVDEWILSGKSYHILRDHPAHSWPMSGGMWGGIRKIRFDFNTTLYFVPKNTYADVTHNDAAGVTAVLLQDMRFLRDVVYPEIENDVLAHDSYFCQMFANSVPFPTMRNGTDHVGARVSALEQLEFDHTQMILQHPPPAVCNTCVESWERDLRVPLDDD